MTIEPQGVPRSPGDARTGRVGLSRLRPVRRQERLADRRGGRRGRCRPSRRVRRAGRGRDRVRSRRAQGREEPGLLDRDRGHLPGPRLRQREHRPAEQDRLDSAARRRGPRADPLDQPGRDGLLQDPAGPDDPQRDRDQPPPLRAEGVRRRRPDHGRGRRRRRGPRRRRAVGRRALDPPDQRADHRRAHRRHRGHRRHRRGPRGLPQRQPGDRRRAGQRARPGGPRPRTCSRRPSASWTARRSTTPPCAPTRAS